MLEQQSIIIMASSTSAYSLLIHRKYIFIAQYRERFVFGGNVRTILRQVIICEIENNVINNL